MQQWLLLLYSWNNYAEYNSIEFNFIRIFVDMVYRCHNFELPFFFFRIRIACYLRQPTNYACTMFAKISVKSLCEMKLRSKSRNWRNEIEKYSQYLNIQKRERERKRVSLWETSTNCSLVQHQNKNGMRSTYFEFDERFDYKQIKKKIRTQKRKSHKKITDALTSKKYLWA